MAQRPVHVVGGHRQRLARLDQFAGRLPLRLEAERQTFGRSFEHDGELPFGNIRKAADLAERHAPIARHVDRVDRAAETAQRIVAQEAIMQRAACLELQVGVERGAHRQAAAIERILAIAIDELAAHVLGEVFAGEEIGAGAPRRDLERQGLGLGALVGLDIAVRHHLVDHPVAALDGAVGVAERMVVGGAAGQGGEIGGLGQRQFVDRLVEIGKGRTRDAVGAETEKDLVQIEFEDAVLRIGVLDTEGENHLPDLAVVGHARIEQEVLGDLLRDGGGAHRTATGAQILDVGDDRAHQAEPVNAGVGVEILVLGRQEGGLDTVGNRLDGQIEPSLAGELRHERAVCRMHARRHRRLVIGENLVVRQVLRDFVDVDSDAGCRHQRQHGADPEEISDET